MSKTPQATVLARQAAEAVRSLNHAALGPGGLRQPADAYDVLGELSLTASRPQGWQLDGDHMGTATGLRVRHVPAALRVVS